MGFMYAVLIIFEALLSALLIVIIFLQKTKGGMGGSAFGGGGGAGEAIFGSRMGNVLTKATVVLGCIFLLNTILLTIMTARRSGRSGSIMDRIETSVPMHQPMIPANAQQQGAPPTGFEGSLPVPAQIPAPPSGTLPVQGPAPLMGELPAQEPIAIPAAPAEEVEEQ